MEETGVKAMLVNMGKWLLWYCEEVVQELEVWKASWVKDGMSWRQRMEVDNQLELSKGKPGLHFKVWLIKVQCKEGTSVMKEAYYTRREWLAYGKTGSW